jgi:ankyrin repeat protein
VRLLLLHKADKNSETHHMSSALLFAVKYSATAAARVLLEEGAATHTKDKDGRTLLMWASSSGNIEIIKMLIASGVSIKAKDALGKTAMQCKRSVTWHSTYWVLNSCSTIMGQADVI